MKYMMLICIDATKPMNADPATMGKMLAGYQVCNETYHRDGVYVSGDALQEPSSATTLRIRNGRAETMDGPFAETKEQLAGFYILDCKDLDEAIHYASLIPNASDGAVEIRPIRVFSGN